MLYLTKQNKLFKLALLLKIGALFRENGSIYALFWIHDVYCDFFALCGIEENIIEQLLCNALFSSN